MERQQRQKKWLIGGGGVLLILVLVSFGIGRACGTGWLQLRLGGFQICGQLGCGPADVTPGEIREVAKLVSIEMDEMAHFKQIISPDLPFSDYLLPITKFFGIEDEIDVSVYGTVTAGFDLDKIHENDLWTDGKRVVLQLPPPEILYIPVNKIVINDHDDWCPNLICADSVEATDEIINRAKTQMIVHSSGDGKILERAAESARRHYEKFFQMMGYEDITIYIDHHPL